MKPSKWRTDRLSDGNRWYFLPSTYCWRTGRSATEYSMPNFDLQSDDLAALSLTLGKWEAAIGVDGLAFYRAKGKQK